MKVFLSYSSAEFELAERLTYSLRNDGHTVFFDRVSLMPGEGYDTRIREAVENCSLFIFLISQDSVSSGSYALTELGLARQKWANPSGRILPVMISEVDFETLPAYLAAVTVLRPRGDLVAEIVAMVNRIESKRRLRIYWSIGGLLVFTLLAISLQRIPQWTWLNVSERIPKAITEPVRVVSSLSNSGWTMNLDIIAEDVIKEVFYRFTENEAYKSTGFNQIRDPRTGLNQPKTYIEVPLFQGTRTLFVKYTLANGLEQGPYKLILDAVKLITSETKYILELTKSSWLAFNIGMEGQRFLYFSHLVSYKNGLKEIQYSVDEHSLSRRVHFVADWSSQGAPGINNDDETYVKIPMSATFVDVKLVFIDGSEWPPKRFLVSGGIQDIDP